MRYLRVHNNEAKEINSFDELVEGLDETKVYLQIVKEPLLLAFIVTEYEDEEGTACSKG